MIAVLLASGSAKRLLPLTFGTPKSLLHVEGRPVLDHVMDKVDNLGQRIGSVMVLTNGIFKADLDRWSSHRADKRITVLDDGSTGGTVGATGAVRFVMPAQQDDLLILAADCLLLDELSGLVAAFDRAGKTVVGLYSPSSTDQVSSGHAVSVDEKGRITKFVERPKSVDSGLVAALMYVFPARMREIFIEYLATGFWTDSPGKFIDWLMTKETVYGYRLSHCVWDIGTLETYARAARYLHGLIC